MVDNDQPAPVSHEWANSPEARQRLIDNYRVSAFTQANPLIACLTSLTADLIESASEQTVALQKLARATPFPDHGSRLREELFRTHKQIYQYAHLQCRETQRSATGHRARELPSFPRPVGGYRDPPSDA
jgi:hypothetical protein